jgi:hypothetical protein
MGTTKRGMSAKQFAELLEQLHACKEARTWATGKTLQEVWEKCERGDWLLWLAGRMEGKSGWHTRQQIVLAACACAETALKYIPAGEDRPRLAIEVARRWAAGGAEIAEVRQAAADAYASASAYAAYSADAAYAAGYAAGYAAYAAAYDADAVSDASAAAAYAAAAAAAYGNDASTRSRKELADIVRRELPDPGKSSEV